MSRPEPPQLLPPAPLMSQTPGRRRPPRRPALRFAVRSPSAQAWFSAAIESHDLGDRTTLDGCARKLRELGWIVRPAD
jgi:hypothetical protein